MTRIDWENITNYIDSVGTTDTVFPFSKAQSSVKVTASGAKDNIIYTIGGQSGTLSPGQNVTVTGSISSMTLRSASGRQPFQVWAVEAGTEKDETDTSYQGQIDGLTTQLAQSAYQDNFIPDKLFYPSLRHHLSILNYAVRNEYSSTSSVKNKPYVITFLGDSLFGYHTRSLVNMLQNTYGINGLGFSKFGTYGNYETISMSGVTIVEDNDTNQDEWGFCGRVHKAATGATISYKPDARFPFNDFKLFFLKMVGGGKFQYRVDGGAWSADIDTSNTTSQLGVTTANQIQTKDTTYVTHQIDIQITSGSVWFYGIQTYTADQQGILLNWISEGGTRAWQWAKNPKYYQAFFDIVDSDQLHSWLGTNDAGSDFHTDTQFESDMNTLLNSFTVKNNCDIVLYTYTPRAIDSNNMGVEDENYKTLTLAYADKLFSIAQTKGLSVFDVHRAFPSRDIGNQLGMFTDAIHPSNDGASYIASKICEFILPSNVNSLASKYADANFKSNVGLAGSIVPYIKNSNGDYIQTPTNGFKFINSNTAAFFRNNVNVVRFNSGGAMMAFSPQSDLATIFNIERIGNSGSFVLTLKTDTNSNLIFDNSNSDYYFRKGGADQLVIRSGSRIQSSLPFVLQNCTLATLPSTSASNKGGLIYVTDATGGATVCYYDGINWKRMKDDTVLN